MREKDTQGRRVSRGKHGKSPIDADKAALKDSRISPASRQAEAKPTVKKGRPSAYTETLAELICERLACGESLRKICDDAAMPDRVTVIRWLAKNEDFATKYARAREVQAHVWVDDMYEAAKAEPERNPVTGAIESASVTHIRNQVATMQWLAMKLNPKKYGDKVDVNHGSQPENPLTLLVSEISGRVLGPGGKV